jgi:hypothetical protein
MKKRIELSNLTLAIFVLCILLISKYVPSAEHGDVVYRVQLYHHEGSPLLQTPVHSDTIIAGTTDTFVAKVFDRNNVWRSDYERSDSGRMYIRWKFEKMYGYGSPESIVLSDTVGHIVIVSSSQAYSSCRIIVSFMGGMKDTVLLCVKPLPVPDILSIQTEKNRRIYLDMKIDTLRLTAAVTLVYAVILDQLGNFVRYATHAVWSSSDTASIVTTPGDSATGECILKANTEKLKNAKIIVWDSMNNSGDTLTVINNIVTASFRGSKQITSGANPVFYKDQGKLRVQFPFAATRIVRFYTLSGNCVSSLMTTNSGCSVVLPPGVYIADLQNASVGHSIRTRILIGR